MFKRLSRFLNEPTIFQKIIDNLETAMKLITLQGKLIEEQNEYIKILERKNEKFIFHIKDLKGLENLLTKRHNERDTKTDPKSSG